MIDKILATIESKGFLIGFFSGVLKVFQDVRLKNFKWVIATTDLGASSIVGYSVYQWAGESDSLGHWQVLGLTIMLSLNAFFVVKIITEPKLISKLLNGWFRTKIIDDDEKKD